MNSQEIIKLTDTYAATNYAPLDVVLRWGEGAWVEDVDGKRYIDFLSAYSSLNLGHRHPRVLRAAREQLDRLTMVSRAFYAENVGELCRDLAVLCGKDRVLLMNTGAEAVETAIKCARKWGYEEKGVESDKAEIIVFDGNFHGRTTTIVGFSSSDTSRSGFGPFTPGFKRLAYGDLEAVERAITNNTVAVLLEPIQGEGGVIIPPAGYLKGVRELCSRHNVLMIADEIWTSLGRTGRLFGCDHEGVVPDIYLIAKSLGGGVVPISAVVASNSVMKVFTAGTHGSTLGGNPFACAVAREVLAVYRDERLDQRAAELGDYFIERLRKMNSRHVTALRGRGLMVGIDIAPEAGTAKDFCKKLKLEGVLCKDTHGQTIRMAPPLVISMDDLNLALERIERVFS
ncbi:MAG: ornithine--oxo-acid transaminase [Pseudomonadota bacterium]